MKISLSKILKKITDQEKLKYVLPEVYELKKFTENDNFYHKNDNLLTHTWKVFKNTKKIINIISNKKRYLNEKIQNYSRKELLLLTALLHDIGKKEALVIKKGITSSYGHEKISAEKANKILRRFDLSKKEKEIVISLIKNHGVLHKLVFPQNKNLEKRLSLIRKKLSNIFIELIILTLADTLSTQLKEIKPKIYSFKIRFYTSLLKINMKTWVKK